MDGLLAAYRKGFFPMAEPARGLRPGRLAWFNPDRRCILPLGVGPGATADHAAFHVPRSLARTVRRGTFRITADTAFDRVIRACAAPRKGEPGTWIDERIIHAYTLLHGAGAAHSIEAWREDKATGNRDEATKSALVGGLYGVRLGGAFFAESKFSRPELGGTDASKVCLVHLVHHLRRRGFTLLDVQFPNPHLEQFGPVEVARDDYLARLAHAVEVNAPWTPFEPERTGPELSQA